MKLTYSLRTDLMNSESLFDFMAFIFSFISNEVSDENQTDFIVNLEEKDVLNKLSEDARSLLNEKDLDEIICNFPKSELLQLCENTKNNQMDKGEGENQVMAEILFVILQAIDTSFSNKDLTYVLKDFGPLNKVPDDCLVYFRGNGNHHSQKSDYYNKDLIGSCGFSRLLTNFIFVLRDSLPKGVGTPKLVHITRTHLKSLSGVTFVCSPWSIEKNFDFVQNRKKITIEYPNIYKEKTNNLISQFISYAVIRLKANIVVFPEYSIPPYGLEIIKKELRNIQGSSSELYFVIAGSTWIKSSGTLGVTNDNVMTILDRFGEEIGNYYKYSPFVKINVEEIPKKTDRVEYFSNPGKEITLIHLDEIGIMLPSICRDIIDEKVTLGLANIFLPAYVIAPAYSASTKSFVHPFNHLSHNLHCNYVYCDFCQSVKIDKNFKWQIGFAGSAKMFDTQVKSAKRGFYRYPSCLDQCPTKPCCFKVDFKWQQTDDGEIVADDIRVTKHFFKL